MSNSQLNKLKSRIKNGTEVTLKFSLNVVGDSNDENNFLHSLSLTNVQVSRLCKAFPKGSPANIKLSKTQLHKIGQSGRLLGQLLRLLLKTGLPLHVIALIILNEEMHNVIKIMKKVNICLIIQIYFLQVIMRRMVNTKIFSITRKREKLY